MKRVGLAFLILFLAASICFVVYRLCRYLGSVYGGESEFGFPHVVIYLFYGGGAIIGIAAMMALFKVLVRNRKD